MTDSDTRPSLSIHIGKIAEALYGPRNQENRLGMIGALASKAANRSLSRGQSVARGTILSSRSAAVPGRCSSLKGLKAVTRFNG